MAFTWKDKKDIWKGEGVYFVTFSVTGRQKLLGTLVRILADGSYAPVYTGDRVDPKALQGKWDFEKYGNHTATVKKSPLGFAIAEDLQNIKKRHPGYEICGKMLMENHLHLVIWVHDDGGKSIKQWAHGFRIGITKIAREMGLWPQASVGGEPVSQAGEGKRTTGEDAHGMRLPKYGNTTEGNGAINPADEAPEHAGDGLILDRAFIRTLSHSGQLKNMLRYTHYNPDNLLLMRDNPSLYVIRRSQRHGGLLFDTMGKGRLVEYPDRNVVALSRSLTEEQIAEEVRKALRLAESGAVTYCAAINEGEKTVTKAVREAGYPLVVMMLDGFPPEGTEAARFFHPGGVYHRMCGEGRLYLMAPLPQNYDNAEVIARTELELKRKAEAKRQVYVPLPHDSKRWRMIAGNVMMGMVGNGE